MPKLSPELLEARRNMNPVQSRAFELYFSMPEGARSYSKTGDAIGKSRKTIQLWATKFKWQELIKERQESFSRKAQNATENELLVQRKTLLNFWKGLLAKCVGKDKEGNQIITLDPKDIADAERITKMILLLSGDVTERTEYFSVIINKVLNVIDIEISDPQTRYRIYQSLGGVLADGGSTAAVAGTGESKS